MSLILITVCDTEDGPSVSVIGEPRLDQGPDVQLTPAQVVALNMLNALKAEPMKQDKGLIQLLTPDQKEDVIVN